jgi:hypothetical protein
MLGSMQIKSVKKEAAENPEESRQLKNSKYYYHEPSTPKPQ